MLSRFFRGLDAPTAVFVATVVTGCLIVALVLVLNTCTTREDARHEAANVDVLATDGAAKEQAAGERLNDTLIINDREKERADATATLPDTRPSDRRIRRACVQLRQQGRRDADLPLACRPAG